MSILIFNHGGGTKELAIKVMGGTVQPTGAAGILWCNTATTIPAWAISVVAQSGPAIGDVWIQTDASSTNIVNLLKRNAAKVNILRVKQWSGTAWVSKAAYYHNGTSWTQISSTFDPATDITYTGTKTVIDDGSGHWRIKFLTSGTLRFLVAPDSTTIDLCLVGAGGGVANASGKGGAGGGYVANYTSITPVVGTDYPVVIGAGTAGGAGGATSAFGRTANGAPSNNSDVGGSGGSGGGGYGGAYGGAGGSNGSNGAAGQSQPGGAGQGTTTREFGDASGALYGPGGGGGSSTASAGGVGGETGGGRGAGGNTGGGLVSTDGAANTGAGGGGNGYGSYIRASAGGSGIAVIRDHR